MGEILTPFLAAAFLAYLGDPLVNRLQRWRLSRTTAATLIFILMLLILTGLALLIIPVLQTQIQILVLKIPDMIVWMQETVMPWLSDHFDLKFNINPVEIKKILVSHWEQTGNVLDKIMQTVTHSTRTVAGFLINLVLIPVVAFYLLRDWPLLLQRIKSLIPRRYLPTVTHIFRQCDDVLGAFFRGQFLVMLILGILYTAGLMIIGLDVAVLIGLLIAILSIVPYLGTIIGLLLGIVSTAFQFHDLKHIIYVLVLFAVGHLLEGMVLTPWLIGDKVGLHPVAVIFAILFAGTLFGFFGVLLAIPLAAVLLVLLKFFYQKYIQSNFYRT